MPRDAETVRDSGNRLIAVVALAAVAIILGQRFLAGGGAPAPEQDPAAAVAGYPAYEGSVRSALDLRGQRGPTFVVDEWITAPVETDGRVTVVDFWATWCGPCVQAIPHMNELAAALGDRVAIVGVSGESREDFDTGHRRILNGGRSFDYALALDPNRRMQSAVQVRGIPHCLVMSADGVVRWQGHPMQLDAATLTAIADASDAAASDA